MKRHHGWTLAFVLLDAALIALLVTVGGEPRASGMRLLHVTYGSADSAPPCPTSYTCSTITGSACVWAYNFTAEAEAGIPLDTTCRVSVFSDFDGAPMGGAAAVESCYAPGNVALDSVNGLVLSATRGPVGCRADRNQTVATTANYAISSVQWKYPFNVAPPYTLRVIATESCGANGDGQGQGFDTTDWGVSQNCQGPGNWLLNATCGGLPPPNNRGQEFDLNESFPSTPGQVLWNFYDLIAGYTSSNQYTVATTVEHTWDYVVQGSGGPSKLYVDGVTVSGAPTIANGPDGGMFWMTAIEHVAAQTVDAGVFPKQHCVRAVYATQP